MNHPITTNARVLHTTLDKLREMKELLGFKTLFETAEYVVAKELNSEPMQRLRAQKQATEAATNLFNELVVGALDAA